MSKDDNMRVLSGTSAVLLIITGLVCLIFVCFTYIGHKADFNGERSIATVYDVSIINGEKIVSAQYSGLGELWYVDFKPKDLSGDYVVGDSTYVYHHKDDASVVLSQDTLDRVRHCLGALIFIAVLSIVGGCLVSKFIVLDWDKRFLKSGKTKGYVDEDLDLFDFDTVDLNRENQTVINRVKQGEFGIQNGYSNEYPYQSPRMMNDYSQSGNYRPRPTNHNRNFRNNQSIK